jgi:thiamine-phosphate pyrophosphorylase
MPQLTDWLSDARLWLVLDREAAAPRSLEEVTDLCLEGGVDAVVFRAKKDPEDVIRVAAQKVQAVCRNHKAPMILSHYPNIAKDIGAEAVQLGVGDMPIELVRAHCEDQLIGFSAHSLDEAQAVAKQGADYIFLGPVFATPSKAGMGRPLGTHIVLAATELGVPTVMIGGISTATLPQIIAAGGSRVAAIRALQAVADPRAAARTLKQMLLTG